MASNRFAPAVSLRGHCLKSSLAWFCPRRANDAAALIEALEMERRTGISLAVHFGRKASGLSHRSLSLKSLFNCSRFKNLRSPSTSLLIWRIFVCAGILLLSFIGVQGWKQENATVPPRITTQRSVASDFFYPFCIGSAMMILVYFVAIWFQVVEDINEYESGIRVLPLV
jgi:hypothetical protein